MIINVDCLKLKCLRCGHKWFPKKDDVRQCPKCRSVLWDVPKNGKPEPVQAKAKPKPKPKQVAQSFEQWWPEVKNSPAYAGIDCERELEKMKVWLTTAKGKHRTLNKGFVVNWLNKIDAPVSGQSSKPKLLWNGIDKQDFGERRKI